jgi:hypothetical protein
MTLLYLVIIMLALLAPNAFATQPHFAARETQSTATASIITHRRACTKESQFL